MAEKSFTPLIGNQNVGPEGKATKSRTPEWSEPTMTNCYSLGPTIENPASGAHIMRIEPSQCSSITQAVAMLKNDRLKCPAGICIVYSSSHQGYYILARSDKEQECIRIARDTFQVFSFFKHVVVVLLQHGSHGSAKDMGTIRKCIETRWAKKEGLGTEVHLEIFTSPANHGLETDKGLRICGEGLAKDLSGRLDRVHDTYPEARIHLVCIGHSFGGPMVRRALASMWKSEKELMQKTSHAVFITLASPHCGARQLPCVLRIGARVAGHVISTTYQDLLLDNTEMDDLAERENLAPLRNFQHRMVYQCAHSDHLVGFETGSLFVPKGGSGKRMLSKLPKTLDGFKHVHGPLTLKPFFNDEQATERQDSQEETKERPLDTNGFPSDMWEEQHIDNCAHPFQGFDDRNNEQRHHRAARMLQAVRNVGEWTAHIIDFPECGVLRHGAIIAHPNCLGNPGFRGHDVADHVAAQVCEKVVQVLQRQ